MAHRDLKRIERICRIWGWALFIASALFFIASSLRSGDMIGLFGGLFFLIACFVFLIPFLLSGHSD